MAELFLGGAIDPATGDRTTDDASSHVQVETDDFTTHGVIVGMTGSGKTGLGVILIEEALRAGVPVLAVDPKGDLTNLCLTFPDLAAADFRPWIDEAQAAAAGSTPDQFAADQAGLWSKGLAGWELSGADIGALRAGTDFTIYTPGSESGVALDIVGSLQVPEDMTDAEVVADEINGYVTGLLGLVGVDADPLSSREHILLSNLINHSWSQGLPLDLMTLVGQVATPPIRKLGVFELDQFFPESDRMGLAMKLNGLLASPAFAAWAAGPPLDIQSMLFTADGRPRCAIVTTAHLSDDERQFVTSLLLSKLLAWMRRQSGVSDLRALLYMDEVAGYLPPTANPPTKQPIMTLMKQARAFGVGVVLSTQNPVDIDYKAISNAGTWMIGRLQTERDKARLLDGMSAAAGGVDVRAVGDTIAGLGKRSFVLRRAGKDQPETFTTRWAMSYLRGPMTRDQIARLMEPVAAAAAVTAASPTATTAAVANSAPTAAPSSPAAPEPALPDDHSAVMPDVADGTAVRFVDVAAPWLADAGGAERGTVLRPTIVARVAMRYDERRADDLVHDDEFECVITDVGEQTDVTDMIRVDYDDRDLRREPPESAVFELTDARIDTKTFWSGVERDVRDHLVRTSTVEITVNTPLKLYGRPGDTPDDFAARCLAAADDRADEEIAKLRDKYETKAKRLRDQLESAEDRLDVLEEQADAKRNSELLSTAGSVLGGLLGGSKSKGGLIGGLLGTAGTAARRRGSTRASQERREAQENKVERLVADLEDLEVELAEELAEIDERWAEAAADVTSMEVGLEKTDVQVTQICLAWMPV